MILGDEMGLGKTLQTISLITHLKEKVTHGQTCPSLVICPLSVLNSWSKEIKRWNPELNFLIMHDSDLVSRELTRQKVMANPTSYDIIVTTYEMAKNPSLSTMFQRLHFQLVVLDEGHIIKNEQAQISIAVRKMHYCSTLILTGTPLQNNLTELWALLNYLFPKFFVSSEKFSNAFDIGKQVSERNRASLEGEKSTSHY